MRQWVNFEITGNKLFDWYNWQQAQQRIKASVNNPDILEGTRIYFQRESKYQYLITALSYMNTVSVERFIFDLRPAVSTLYVLAGKRPAREYTRIHLMNVFVCGTPDHMSIYSEPLPSLKESFDKLMQRNGLQLADFFS